MKQRLLNILYAFPVQLVVLHFKKNVLLLSFWAILLLFITGGIGKSFGLKYLFLDPEYLHQVNFWSFYFVGLAFAGFVTAWNISTYLLHSTRFPFIASLHRPFIQFSVNNSLFPILFIAFYFYKIINFQGENGASSSMIWKYLLGFVAGFSTALLIFVIYFRLTNKDIFSYDVNRRYKTPKFLRGLVRQRDKNQERTIIDKNKWHVDFYISGRLQFRRVRSVAHYNQKILTDIFNQHHKNATVLQLLTIVALIGLGFLMDFKQFRIPAGASIMILFAMFTSVLGALWYWLRGWHVFTILGLLIIINAVTVNTDSKFRNKAYGLNYKTEKAIYSNDSLVNIQNATIIQQDIKATLKTLNNWRSQFGEKNPKLVMIGVSGGGLRASLWSMRVLQHSDSLLNNNLTKQTTLVTGASGGMLGAAYYRGLYQEFLFNRLKNNLYHERYLKNIGQDLQNAVAFSITVNDLFVPLSTFKIQNQRYPKDRGYLFERQFHENTKNLLSKRIIDFQEIESSGKIPMLVITPSIANDGKRFIISSQGVTYLTAPKTAHKNPKSHDFDGVDFRRFFQNQAGDNLEFSTALRMNATYPYILPNVHLPTSPPIEVVDAGWRDNTGVDLPVRFAHVFKDWIDDNTDGIIFIQIRAFAEEDTTKLSEHQGIIKSLFNPLGLVGQFMHMQNFHKKDFMNYIKSIYDEDKVDLIQFFYSPSKLNEEASMSFHLTEKEKEDIINAIYLEHNKASTERLKELLE
ncbi:MAG: patatin-like phospholipase family protein [Saprospiraceae bacterium]